MVGFVEGGEGGGGRLTRKRSEFVVPWRVILVENVELWGEERVCKGDVERGMSEENSTTGLIYSVGVVGERSAEEMRNGLRCV